MLDLRCRVTFFFFFFNDTATTEIYTLSLHDALPIWLGFQPLDIAKVIAPFRGAARRQQELFSDARFRLFDDYGHHPNRSEEHTSELQSQSNLVCRLLLEKKKNNNNLPRLCS